MSDYNLGTPWLIRLTFLLINSLKPGEWLKMSKFIGLDILETVRFLD